jgi:hypothetical protein
MDFERVLKLAGGMAAAQREFPTPFEAGMDCARNGANVRNCHFGFFGSKESTAEWERGKKAAAYIDSTGNPEANAK